MESTDNYRKHTTKSKMQRYLIDNFYKTLISETRKLQPESILDVGCGEGFTLDKLQNEGIGKKLEGVDFLHRAIEIGKKEHPGLNLNQGDIYDLKYKEDSFDLVICSEVLEHLEDPAAALAELVRVTKKYVLLSVPNEPLFMLGNFLRGKNISRWGNDIEHIQHWSSTKFKNFVQSQLDVRIIRTPLPWTMIIGEKLR